jgi:hypothetical protein
MQRDHPLHALLRRLAAEVGANAVPQAAEAAPAKPVSALEWKDLIGGGKR